MIVAALPSSMTIADWAAWAEALLDPVTDIPRLEAELLIAESSGLGRASIIAHPDRVLNPDVASLLEALVTRRASGEPLAYIVGKKEFYSLSFSVGPAVLVPRPETETLVDAALERIPRDDAKVLDLGTGSGAIALALKHERPDLDVTAVDIDPAALEIARANAKAMGLAVNWLRSDWFAALGDQRFDLIVSNPPYVASDDAHFDQGLDYEPRIALDGGKDGLDAYREIFEHAKAYLAPNGLLLVEHGFDQREAVATLARSVGLRLETGIDDLAGLPRVAGFVAEEE
jgi:release factor glutamine methyltransferase